MSRTKETIRTIHSATYYYYYLIMKSGLISVWQLIVALSPDIPDGLNMALERADHSKYKDGEVDLGAN